MPLAEAMALSVPVVARDAGALAETLGDAGLVWHEDDPRLYAASVARLRRDAQARAALHRRRRALPHALRAGGARAATARLAGAARMKRLAVVVQRCHAQTLGGSEALAWHYAQCCASTMRSRF